MRKIWLSALWLPLWLSAEVVLLEPAADKVVSLIPRNQKELIAMSGHAVRKTALAEAKKAGKREGVFGRSCLWRQALPLAFRWKCTENEPGPFRVMLAETADFKKAKVFFSRKAKEITPPNYELNFKLGQKYFWRVSAGKHCSKTASFTTKTHPPRWIASEGKVGNIRDLGGWKTTDGLIVKQGLVFRGEGLNEVTRDGIHAGRSRLMAADISLFCDELGIRTDLDLRRPAETADLKASPLGSRVQFKLIPTPSYWDIFSPKGKQAVAEVFRVFADPGNHPVYFHCQAGRDRTGTVAFILNGVLGVPEKDLASDFEHSQLPWMPAPQEKDNYDEMVKCFCKYGKPEDSLKSRIEKYLMVCGIRSEEIDAFRKMMLVKQ